MLWKSLGTIGHERMNLKKQKTLGIIDFQGFAVPPVGFEPTTHDLKGRCSNR